MGGNFHIVIPPLLLSKTQTLDAWELWCSNSPAPPGQWLFHGMADFSMSLLANISAVSGVLRFKTADCPRANKHMAFGKVWASSQTAGTHWFTMNSHAPTVFIILPLRKPHSVELLTLVNVRRVHSGRRRRRRRRWKEFRLDSNDLGQGLCERREPGFPVPDSPYGLSGHKSTLKKKQPSLTVSVDVNQHWRRNNHRRFAAEAHPLFCVFADVITMTGPTGPLIPQLGNRILSDHRCHSFFFRCPHVETSRRKQWTATCIRNGLYTLNPHACLTLKDGRCTLNPHACLMLKNGSYTLNPHTCLMLLSVCAVEHTGAGRMVTAMRYFAQSFYHSFSTRIHAVFVTGICCQITGLRESNPALIKRLSMSLSHLVGPQPLIHSVCSHACLGVDREIFHFFAEVASDGPLGWNSCFGGSVCVCVWGGGVYVCVCGGGGVYMCVCVWGGGECICVCVGGGGEGGFRYVGYVSVLAIIAVESKIINRFIIFGWTELSRGYLESLNLLLAMMMFLLVVF